MNQPTIYITKSDAEKLRQLIQKANYSEYRGSPYLKQLAGELEKAQIVEPKEVPPDVITLNSKVRLVDEDLGEEMIYTLVFPEEADVTQGKISVLAPIGTAMLGYRVGDVFQWDTPGGKCTMRVKEIIYQPEAAGDYQ
ncbi:MAG: nucleoside diphosphate kinase regulator [Chloroflexi bacterium]|jgi:regulator of nucleoside diphosphate kinase|nr:nucleoside diphosphate kinase regulator [Chloroflexota bacterium]